MNESIPIFHLMQYQASNEMPNSGAASQQIEWGQFSGLNKFPIQKLLPFDQILFELIQDKFLLSSFYYTYKRNCIMSLKF